MIEQSIQHFQTVFGRSLLPEFQHYVPAPHLIVTMEDLWPKLKSSFDASKCITYFVTDAEDKTLKKALAGFPEFSGIIALGGGMAIDVGKYLSWLTNKPVFYAPTSLSVDAMFTHRAGIRFGGDVKYLGWAVPQAVYFDWDVIMGAPKIINRCGAGDVLCQFTGVLDWQLAHQRGKLPKRWEYRQEIADVSLSKVAQLLAHKKEIHEVSEKGMRVLVDGLAWGGASYHALGWLPCHVEGAEHFFFYALEFITKKKFLHGQPVALGVYIALLMHDHPRAEEFLDAIYEIGIDIRPEAMNTNWDMVEATLKQLKDFVVGRPHLWHSIAHERTIDAAFVKKLRTSLTARFKTPPAN